MRLEGVVHFYRFIITDRIKGDRFIYLELISMKTIYSPELSKNQKKFVADVINGLFEKYRLFKYLTSDNICEDENRGEWETFCKEIESVVERLPDEEREIICSRYMVDDYVKDQEVYKELDISHVLYAKRREKAFGKIAFFLQINGD